MNIDARIVIFIIIIEITIVIAIVIAAYITKLISWQKNREKQRILFNVEHSLEKLLANHKNFSAKQFQSKWRILDVLLYVIEKLDKKNVANQHWLTIRKQFIEEVLIPEARTKCQDKAWITRLLAARAFAYDAKSKDEKCLISLLHDDIPLIYEYAIFAIVKFGSEKSLNEVITRIANERRIAQTIALQFFSQAPQQVQNWVTARLAKEKNPYAKATCYKILCFFPAKKNTINCFQDIKSENIELTLAAVRYLAHAEKKDAIPHLVKLLHHNNWIIRANAAKLLGQLDAKEALKALEKCLHDTNWSVRMNAAEALKALGTEGVDLLKAQAPTDKFAYETAHHVLEIKPED